MQEFINVPAEKLCAFMKEVFVKVGVPPEDAGICSDVLIQSDLRGIESHGINRLKMYVDRIEEGTQHPVSKWKIAEDKGATAVIDAGHGMGHVVAYHAMKLTIEKAAQYGCSVVTVKNGTHFGIAGYYPLMAVKHNMIGVTMTNARPSVAPTFGTEPLLGTNPIAFGAPSDMPFPFLLDMATSITQRGKIEVLEKLGKPTPEGWVVDRGGKSATDSKGILEDLTRGEAALLALGGIDELGGGHKGYGLSTMVEILSAALSNANYLRETCGVKEGENVPLGLGHFFLAINVSHFIHLDLFKRIVGNIMRELSSSRKAPGDRKSVV